jgi:hypothetical protein
MAQDCARCRSGQTRSRTRGRARVWRSGRRDSGREFWQRPHRWVCHRGRTDITLPGWKPFCRDPLKDPQQSYPRLGSKPVPAPRTRYEVRDMHMHAHMHMCMYMCMHMYMSPSGFHRRDRLKHPLPSASKCVRGRVCKAFPKRTCWFFDWGNIWVSWFLGNLGNWSLGNLRNRLHYPLESDRVRCMLGRACMQGKVCRAYLLWSLVILRVW